MLETESVKSMKADPELGQNLSKSHTAMVTEFTLEDVTDVD